MELEKAIELNTKVLKTFDARLEITEKEALKLGIEALIFSKNVLALMPIVFQLPKPGETEK